jgi:hypothetical protein
MTIHDFLAERLVEEEATLELHENLFQDASEMPAELLAMMIKPDALRADLAAIRRLMGLHQPRSPMFNPEAMADRCATCMGGAESWPCKTIRVLATRFESHAQFREEWRG